jgi:hypothetical protein
VAADLIIEILRVSTISLIRLRCVRS